MALTKAPEELLARDLTSALSITTADNTSQLTLTSTDTDANVGPRMDLTRDSSSPAASDSLGQIRFMGEDAGDNSISYAHMTSFIVDPTDGSEDGKFEIDVRKAGTQRSRLLLDENETVFNNEQQNIDFRVEGDSSANLFVVDASTDRIGIGTNSPTGPLHLRHSTPQFYIQSDDGNSGSIVFGDASDASRGQIQYTTNDEMEFKVNDLSTALTIDANGRVGISAAPEFTSTFEALEIGTTALITPSDTNGRLVTNLYYDGAYKRKHTGASLQYEQDGAGHIWYYDSSASADSSFTQTEMMRLGTTGNLQLSLGNLVIGTSGQGIDFSATGDSSGSMGSELLDDYEEGTWTPVLVAGTTNPTGGGAQNPQGSYTKIGNRVFVTYYVGRTWTNTPAGAIYVSGFPFTVGLTASNANYHYVATYNVDFGGGMTMGVPSAGGTNLQLYQVTNNGAWTAINWTTHTNGTTIYLTGSFSYSV